MKVEDVIEKLKTLPKDTNISSIMFKHGIFEQEWRFIELKTPKFEVNGKEIEIYHENHNS